MSVVPESKPITDYYDNFTLIDRDAQGGYARGAQARSLLEDGHPMRAFKVMRNETFGIKLSFEEFFEKRFVREFEILQKIANGPALFTRLHDSGFVREDLLKILEKRQDLPYNLGSYQTGLDLERFRQTGWELHHKQPDRWRPYLVVDLAPYEYSLFRMVRRRHAYTLPRPAGRSFAFISRFGIGDILDATVRLLDGIAYFHEKTGYLYWDYKPEHIYWGPGKEQIQDTQKERTSSNLILDLIDYNVPRHILRYEDEQTGKLTGEKSRATIRQEMKTEIANICGAMLYPALVMETLGGQTLEADPGKGVHPSDQAGSRYLRDEPIKFYEAEQYLDEDIKQILNRALQKSQGFASIAEFKKALLDYAKANLGLDLENPANDTSAGKQYRAGMRDLRLGLVHLQKARQNFRQGHDLADEENLNADEFFYLLQAVEHTLEHYVLP